MLKKSIFIIFMTLSLIACDKKDAGVAHNLFHEWLHKIGFVHAASYSTNRNYSVPYAIGTIMGELGKNFL